jgi:hypothetical protein
VRPEKDCFALEVKIANEIVYDHVWDKLDPPTSVACSKWYIKKAPFVHGVQPLDGNLLSHCWPA